MVQSIYSIIVYNYRVVKKTESVSNQGLLKGVPVIAPFPATCTIIAAAETRAVLCRPELYQSLLAHKTKHMLLPPPFPRTAPHSRGEKGVCEVLAFLTNLSQALLARKSCWIHFSVFGGGEEKGGEHVVNPLASARHQKAAGSSEPSSQTSKTV